MARVESWPALALAVALGLSCGCAGYRLGPSNELVAGTESIFVEPFRNETLQPRLEDEVTREVRKGLVREGTFRLGHRAEADLVLRGTVTSYSRQGVSFDPIDAQTVTDYSVVLQARVTLSRRSNGEVLWQRVLAGTTQVRAQGDLQSAERQATPLLAANLARQVVDLVADGDW